MTVPRRPFFATSRHSAALLLCCLLLLPFFSSAAIIGRTTTTTAAGAFVPAATATTTTTTTTTTARARASSRPSRRRHLRPDPPFSATAPGGGSGVGDDATTSSSGGGATMMAAASSSSSASSSSIADIGEITDFASKNGIELRFTTRGPGYRCVAASKAHPENVLGYVEGFVRPAGGILHADKMEIFERGGGGTFLGPGLLVAYVCFLHGKDCGCKIAEFLAIDDAEYQHKRLIRYYKIMGFREVRYVGEEIRDIPDRLVWGGVGTLMTEDIDAVLTKWTRIIRRSSVRMGD